MGSRCLFKEAEVLPGKQLSSAAWARRGGRWWEWEPQGGEGELLCQLRKDWWGRDAWGRTGIRHAWVWGMMTRTWFVLLCGEEPSYEVSRESTDPDLFHHPSLTWSHWAVKRPIKLSTSLKEAVEIFRFYCSLIFFFLNSFYPVWVPFSETDS